MPPTPLPTGDMQKTTLPKVVGKAKPKKKSAPKAGKGSSHGSNVMWGKC